jgi:hypothetical protein
LVVVGGCDMAVALLSLVITWLAALASSSISRIYTQILPKIVVSIDIIE